MSWTEVDLTIAPRDPWTDIAMAELGELGYDTFEETSHGVKAYILTAHFDRIALNSLMVVKDPHVKVNIGTRMIEARNWNAEWESSFEPVEVGKAVRIRAEFHPHVDGFAHPIVITPRMAFGTGHHATTRMMVESMLPLDLRGKHVCDLGCGTALLAILAERLGAASVEAIDIDQGAVDNARETVVLNGCTRIVVEKGDAALLRPDTCGAILANIERNTLVRDMPAMAGALRSGGILLLSGFVKADIGRMEEAVRSAGLLPTGTMEQGEWALVKCERPA
ncbi:MAG TPA: 50S ribosomal protein L11 methyltransferase [Flavobacteriales bacterium]